MMPLDMPPWRVVYHYFHQWTKSGWWRRDPALKVVCGRRPHSDADLASQPTISRFENRIRRRELLECAKVLARLAVAQVPARSRQIIIEVDSTDDPCHGQQELEGFNAYYDAHCYLPLLVHIIGEDGRRWQVASVLRPGRSHASCGFEAVLKRVLALVRERFPQAHCIIRPKPTTQYD